MAGKIPKAGYQAPVYIVDGARTPFIKARGKPGSFTAADLAHAAGRPLLARLADKVPPVAFDHVILGNVMAGPDEANIARVASLRLGFGNKVPAFTVHRNCASGMQAVDCAALEITTGRADLVLAGGVEAMSHAPLLWSRQMAGWLGDLYKAQGVGKAAAFARLRPSMLKPVIGLLLGLTDPIVGLNMGQTAEELAHRFGITREEMDRFAMESHMGLARAQDEKRLAEIEPLFDAKGKVYIQDDGLRRETTLEALAKLKPAFDKPFGAVTAGNSAQITDGAAWLVVASQKAVEKYDLPVLAQLRHTRWAGVPPEHMGLGPANAMALLLVDMELSSEDIGHWEINEAFAAQVLAVMKAFADPGYLRNEAGVDASFAPIPRERLNVDGGAICIGHPVGASGARIILRGVHNMRRHDDKYGVASLCIGGGQGGAVLLERTTT
ncbi:MAG: acetyl-CoA C-acetyltransferase [Nitrospinota bacterium]|nr:acetyl-CoA C-acetyltransferase [Nitrospinota bacterium]